MQAEKLYHYTLYGVKAGSRILATFLDLLLIYFLAMYIGSIIILNKNFVESEEGVQVYLISNGVHLDICLPLDSGWNIFIPPSDFQSGNYRYISLGWGEENFYLRTPTWNDLTLHTALYGALVPSPTAMHVTYYKDAPRPSKWVKSIMVSLIAYQKLCNEVKGTFKLNDHQKPILIDCCRYPGVNDNFYKAKGSYHLFNTCNEWVNHLLKKSGLKALGWAPFDQSLLDLYD